MPGQHNVLIGEWTNEEKTHLINHPIAVYSGAGGSGSTDGATLATNRHRTNSTDGGQAEQGGSAGMYLYFYGASVAVAVGIPFSVTVRITRSFPFPFSIG